MTFQKYQMANNAKGQLEVGISAVATNVILKAGYGALFPAHNGTTDKDYLGTLVKFDTDGVTVLKREIVKVTARSTDTFIIERGAGTCPGSDAVQTQGTTAYAFDADDYFFLNNIVEVIEDIQEEIERLETDKANDADVVKLTGNQTVNGIKTFPTSPIVPTPTTDYQASTKKYVDDQINANSGLKVLEIGKTYPGENLTSGKFVFSEKNENPILSETTDAIGSGRDGNENTTNAWGDKFTTNKECILYSVTKDPICTATRAILRSSGGTILATGTFSGDIAVFSTPYLLANGTTYRMEVDNNGGIYKTTWYNGYGFPVNGTNINYIGGSKDGGDNPSSTQHRNIDAITTKEYIYQKANICDNVNNTNISFAIFGSGIEDDKINLFLAKVGSPANPIGIRIETDDNGKPSGTLADVNAYGSIVSANIGVGISDQEIVLNGSISLNMGTKYHLVIFHGTYGSETIDASNYYQIGYKSENTSTRGINTYNGSIWGSIDQDKFCFVQSDLILSTVLSFTDAKYSYKINRLGVVKTSVDIGTIPLIEFEGMSDKISGMDENVVQYLSDTPGNIDSTPGTNTAIVGLSVNSDLLLFNNPSRKAKGTSSGAGTVTIGFYPTIVIYSSTDGATVYLDEAGISNKTETGFDISGAYDRVAIG